jgi:hypothetical protein
VRRATLVLLAVTLLVVAGWSSVGALAAPTTASERLVSERADAPGVEVGKGADVPVPHGVLVGGSESLVVLVTAAPVTRAVLERAEIVVLTAVVAIAIGLLLVGSGPRRRRAMRVPGPGREPLVLVAPRRGPPVLPTRLPAV